MHLAEGTEESQDRAHRKYGQGASTEAYSRMRSRGAGMSKNFDGGKSGHAGADGSAPQAWVWSQYKGVLPRAESSGSTIAKEAAPPAASRSQIKTELPQIVSDRQSAPDTEALIRTDRARRPLAVVTGLAAAVLILVVLAWLFSPRPTPDSQINANPGVTTGVP